MKKILIFASISVISFSLTACTGIQENSASVPTVSAATDTSISKLTFIEPEGYIKSESLGQVFYMKGQVGSKDYSLISVADTQPGKENMDALNNGIKTGDFQSDLSEISAEAGNNFKNPKQEVITVDGIDSYKLSYTSENDGYETISVHVQVPVDKETITNITAVSSIDNTTFLTEVDYFLDGAKIE